MDQDKASKAQEQNQEPEQNKEQNQPTPAEKAMQEQLQSLTGQIGNLQETLKDPEVLKVLELKQQGQEVSVAQKQEKPEIDVLDTLLNDLNSGGAISDPDASGDSDEEKKVDTKLQNEKLLKGVDALVEDRVAKLVAPMQEQLKAAENALEADRLAAYQKNLNADLEKAVEKYPDMSEFKDTMAELYEHNPNLSIEEYYILARHRKLGDEFWSQHAKTDSEFPVTLGQRGKPRPKDIRQGKSGFEQMLNEAVESRHR